MWCSIQDLFIVFMKRAAVPFPPWIWINYLLFHIYCLLPRSFHAFKSSTHSRRTYSFTSFCFFLFDIHILFFFFCFRYKCVYLRARMLVTDQTLWFKMSLDESFSLNSIVVFILFFFWNKINSFRQIFINSRRNKNIWKNCLFVSLLLKIQSFVENDEYLNGNENIVLNVERTLAQIDQPSTQRYTFTYTRARTFTLIHSLISLTHQ